MMIEPKSILRNFWLKVFSLALATAIWLGIHFNLQSDRELSISHINFNSIRVPVGIVTTEGDKRVFKVTPSEVVAFAIADEAALKRGIRVYVDLTDYQGGSSRGDELHIEAPPEWKAFTMPETVAVQQVSQ